MPPPPVMPLAGALNPIEMILNSLNTNTYLIGLSMILLNLGGRHLAQGLTPEQDRMFQNPWMRRIMLFVVIFVATRNVFTALWLSLALILVIGYLFNESSALYLFGEPTPAPPSPPPAPSVQGLTGEEQDILKRLHDKAERLKSAEGMKVQEASGPKDTRNQLIHWYKENMTALRQFIGAT